MTTPTPTEKPTPPSPHSGAFDGVQAVNNRQLLRWMFQFLRPVVGLAAVTCAYLVVQIGLEIITVRQVGQATNQINALHRVESVAGGFWPWIVGAEPQAIRLRWAVGLLTALVVAQAVMRYFREVSQTKLSMEMVYHLRAATYDKLQRVGFGFHDAMSTGQLINRALSDLQNVRSFLQTALLTVLEIGLVVFGYIILLITRSPWVAVLSLAPLPLWTWYILRFSKKVQPAAQAVMEAGDRNVAVITESIAGVHVIKAFATEGQEIAKYGDNCDDYFQRVRRRIRLFANFNPIIQGIASGSHLSLYLALTILCLVAGVERPGDFLILGGAMWAILSRLQQVAAINDQYQNAIVSAKRLYEVLAARPTVHEKPDAPPMPVGPGEVRFENVTFGYQSRRPVLDDISFTVPGGSIVAIVGPTGAGKTTLVNLIARFYDPDRGRVLIDGADIRDLDLGSLRQQVSFVFQETYLFSDTVKANIAYGRPRIDGGEVEAAARLSQAHDFIEELPRKYETVLAERGASLSGGQRQRLAIARAILQNPRILVLDDATAAVDPETEDLIRRAMRFVMRGRTTFVIAHRLGTVKTADMVIVLEHGRVAQVGTHRELIRQPGHYQDVAMAQLYGDETPDAEPPSHMDRVRRQKRLNALDARSGDARPGDGPAEPVPVEARAHGQGEAR